MYLQMSYWRRHQDWTEVEVCVWEIIWNLVLAELHEFQVLKPHELFSMPLSRGNKWQTRREIIFCTHFEQPLLTITRSCFKTSAKAGFETASKNLCHYARQMCRLSAMSDSINNLASSRWYNHAPSMTHTAFLEARRKQRQKFQKVSVVLVDS